MDKQLAAPCGLYCGACGVYIATQENNEKLREKFAGAFGVTPAQAHCAGCLSDDPESIFLYCRVCPIKSCTKEKKIEGCFQCDEFPCAKIEAFPIAEGKKVILRSVPRWREIGTERWLAEEAARYSCPSCHVSLYRGARFCRNCKTPLDQG
ncbi:MAG: DUF3795 domain-containing protein [Spirochaetes bacterium]|nr:DUF3795 domain-containing protein [Spirochaetota bacterium]